MICVNVRISTLKLMRSVINVYLERLNESFRSYKAQTLFILQNIIIHNEIIYHAQLENHTSFIHLFFVN